MKLYNHDGVWQLPGKQSKGAVRIDISISAPAMVDFLNDRNVPPYPVFEAESVASSLTTPEKIEQETAEIEAKWDRNSIINSNTPEAQAEAKRLMTPVETNWNDTGAIKDFILNQASIDQVSEIFASLGTRFAEARGK